MVKLAKMPMSDFIGMTDLFIKDDSEATPESIGEWLAIYPKIFIELSKNKSGRVIGCGAVVDDDIRPLLDLMYIAPKYRNKKIGSQIIHNLQSSFKSLTLIARTEEAIRFYKRNGFQIERIGYHWTTFNEHVTVMHWEKSK